MENILARENERKKNRDIFLGAYIKAVLSFVTTIYIKSRLSLIELLFFE